MWGFYTKDIVHRIEEFFLSTRTSGKNWLAKVIVKIWSVYDNIWFVRNQAKHDKGNIKDNKTHELANQEIREIIQQIPPRRFLPLPEQRLFKMTQEILETKTLRFKHKWIRNAKVILQKFYDEQEMVEEVKLFRTYISQKRSRIEDNVQTMDITKDGG
jgi:hypothetical protein